MGKRKQQQAASNQASQPFYPQSQSFPGGQPIPQSQPFPGAPMGQPYPQSQPFPGAQPYPQSQPFPGMSQPFPAAPMGQPQQGFGQPFPQAQGIPMGQNPSQPFASPAYPNPYAQGFAQQAIDPVTGLPIYNPVMSQPFGVAPNMSPAGMQSAPFSQITPGQMPMGQPSVPLDAYGQPAMGFPPYGAPAGQMPITMSPAPQAQFAPTPTNISMPFGQPQGIGDTGFDVEQAEQPASWGGFTSYDGIVPETAEGAQADIGVAMPIDSASTPTPVAPLKSTRTTVLENVPSTMVSGQNVMPNQSGIAPQPSNMIPATATVQAPKKPESVSSLPLILAIAGMVLCLVPLLGFALPAFMLYFCIGPVLGLILSIVAFVLTLIKRKRASNTAAQNAANQQPRQPDTVNAPTGSPVQITPSTRPDQTTVIPVVQASAAQSNRSKKQAKAPFVVSLVALILTTFMTAAAVFIVISNFDALSKGTYTFKNTVALFAPSSSSKSSGSKTTSSGSPKSSAQSSASNTQANLLGQLNSEQTAAYNVVNERLNAVRSQDPATLDAISVIANQAFIDEYKFSMTDWGIDPLEFVRVMTQGFDYEITTVDVANAGSTSDFVSAKITCRNIFNVVDTFDADLKEFEKSPERQSMTQLQMAERFGGFFMNAVNNAPITNNETLEVEVVQENGAWTISQESWDKGMRYFFGVSWREHATA